MKRVLGFEYLAAPARVLVGHDGRATGLECVRMELGEPDESGRRRPLAVPGSAFVIPCDTVIPAIGLSVDVSWLSGEVELSSQGTLAADPVDFQTSLANVFAGGDAVRGPATLIDAIGDGQRAAFAIERALTGADTREEYLSAVESSRIVPRHVPLDDFEEEIPRAVAEHVSADSRVQGFVEVVQTLTAEQACREAGRCLRCDLVH